MFFQRNQKLLPKGFESILTEFLHIYLAILSEDEFRSEISEIRVEGHTSRERVESDDQHFLYNLDLANGRAFSVLELLLEENAKRANATDEQKEWVRRIISGSGFSYNKLKPMICDRGQPGCSCDSSSPPNCTMEDIQKSRRVTFRVVIDTASKLVQIIDRLDSLNQELEGQ